MKTVMSLFFCIILCISNGFSQIEKGSKMMGFNLSANYEQNKDNTGFKTYSYKSGFNINPNLGFFVAKNSCIGISTGYQYKKSFSNDYNIKSLSAGVFDTSYIENKSVTNSFHLDFFYRKYWFLNDKFSLAANFSTGATYGIVKNKFNNDDYNNTKYSYAIGFNLGLSPVMIFFPHPQYGIELGYGYIGYNYSATIFNKVNSSTYNGFKLNFGPSSLRLGFHYYMFKKSINKN